METVTRAGVVVKPITKRTQLALLYAGYRVTMKNGKIIMVKGGK